MARIAIIGAGIGGLALAGFLRTQEHEVRIYEQATQLSRVGAGIQMSPNAMRVLRALGQEAAIHATAFKPPSWANRVWNTGEMMFDLPLGDAMEQRYGAPYYLMHRADLYAALQAAVDPATILLGRKLTGLAQEEDCVRLGFEDGTTETADIVIGADGVHSCVRAALFGPPRFNTSGRVAYRSTFPASLIAGEVDARSTKWWGEDRHIVIYPIRPDESEIYFVTSVPEPDWIRESWTGLGDMGQLREAFVGFHDNVQRVLAACPNVHKWALLERDPMPAWSAGRVTLLGDACHPMTPYMAQGAASAMEDAAVLSRCLAHFAGDHVAAFARYYATRYERTARLQLTSHGNQFMRGPTDGSWVYGYDPITTELVGA